MIAIIDENITYVKVSARDLWSVDSTIAKIVHPLLVEYRANPMGYPATITDEEWIVILDKMIYSMKSLVDDAFYSAERGEVDIIQEGFELFGKYFTHLWQ